MTQQRFSHVVMILMLALLTFNSLHSRESVNAGNISSYFSSASWKREHIKLLHFYPRFCLLVPKPHRALGKSHPTRRRLELQPPQKRVAAATGDEEGGGKFGIRALRPLTLAFSSSTMKWHRAALKKYSLALYLSKGLSIVLVPTSAQRKGMIRAGKRNRIAKN